MAATRWGALVGPGGAAGVAGAAWLLPAWTAWAPWALVALGWGLVALVLALGAGASRQASRPWVLVAMAVAMALVLQAPEAMAAWAPAAKAWWLAGLGVAGALALLPPWRVRPVAPFARRVARRLAQRQALGALDWPAHQAALVGLRPGLGAWLEAIADARGAWPVLGLAAALAGGAPAWAFLAMAWLELALLWRDRAARPDALAQALDAVARPAPTEGPWVAPWYDSPLTVELGPEAAAALAPRRGALAEALEAESGLLAALGGALAEAQRQGGAWPAWLRPVGDLPPEGYALRVRGAMVAEGELRAGARLARPWGTEALAGRPEQGGAGLWLTGPELVKARRLGLELLRPEALLAQALREAFDEHQADFAPGPWAPARALVGVGL